MKGILCFSATVEAANVIGLENGPRSRCTLSSVTSLSYRRWEAAGREASSYTMNLSGSLFPYDLRRIPPLAFTISAHVSIIFLNGATSDENGPVIARVAPTRMALGALGWESTSGTSPARCKTASTRNAVDPLHTRAYRDF